MEKCLHRWLRLEEQKGDHKITSENPNCRKWLPVLEGKEERVRVDYQSSRALPAGVPPEGGKREDRTTKEGLLQLVLGFCKGYSHAPTFPARMSEAEDKINEEL